MNVELWFPLPIGFQDLTSQNKTVTKEKVFAWLEKNDSKVIRSEKELQRTTYFNESDCFLDDANLHELKLEILKESAFYIETLGGKLPSKFRIQSWINIFDKNTFESQHAHYGSILSGCYYVECPSDSARFFVEDPIEVRRYWFNDKRLNFEERNDLSRDYIYYSPRSGLLLIFLPWMQHGVEIHNKNENRISIAFNLLFE
jgi:uncharacterized protein (TIGR02466 family)